MMAAIGTLLLPAAADAKTKTLKGKVKGDADSKVTVVLTVGKSRRGEIPVTIKKLSFSGVDSTCDREFSGVVRKVPVRPTGTSYTYDAETLESGASMGSNAFRVTGSITGSRKRGTGTIDLFSASGQGTFSQCGEVRFTAKAKKK